MKRNVLGEALLLLVTSAVIFHVEADGSSNQQRIRQGAFQLLRGLQDEKPNMFLLRKDDNSYGNHCLSFEQTATLKSPGKPDVPIYGINAVRCDPSDENQQWIPDKNTSKGGGLIRSKSDPKSCMENELGRNRILIEKCDDEKMAQRMKISKDGSIQIQNAYGDFEHVTLAYYNCGKDTYGISTRSDDNDVALWDIVTPEDYVDPTPQSTDDLGKGKAVLLVSEEDPKKCVGSGGNLDMKNCRKDDKTLIWYTDDNLVWSKVSGEIYDYTWNRGVSKGECCLAKQEYSIDDEKVGPLFQFDDCESDEFGFTLVPPDLYDGPPNEPEDISSEDFVQLQVGNNNLCLRAFSRWNGVDANLELAECSTEAYNVEDDQLWFVETGFDVKDTIRIRPKVDLTLCVDFAESFDPKYEDDIPPYKTIRLSRCENVSDRQHWSYGSKGDSELSHQGVPGFIEDDFCVEDSRICRYWPDRECDEDSEYTKIIQLEDCDGTKSQRWKFITNEKCSREETPRKQYPKEDYFLLVDANDIDRCWENDVTENMGINLNRRCHMTIPRRFNSQIIYFEEGKENEQAVRIRLREIEDTCMGLRNDKLKDGACIHMDQRCDPSQDNQEWFYDEKQGTISPANRENLCVSSDCSECQRETCGDGYSDCGSFCLKPCAADSKTQSFKAMTIAQYRKERDYAQGIDSDEIFMVVLKEAPEYCIKAYDSLELQDIVVKKCKVVNAEQHWTFEDEDKGTRWRSVENPHLFVEPIKNEEGQKLILNEDEISKKKQHWKIRINKDGTIRPAPKDYLCITRDVCKAGVPAEKNDNIELVPCDEYDSSEKERIQFELVRPSEYTNYIKRAVEIGK